MRRGDELPVLPDGSHLGARDPEDGDFRGVDDRCKGSAADAAEAGDREAAPLKI